MARIPVREFFDEDDLQARRLNVEAMEDIREIDRLIGEVEKHLHGFKCKDLVIKELNEKKALRGRLE